MNRVEALVSITGAGRLREWLLSGAPNEKKYIKYLECSFPLPYIVLWPLRGIFVRANII